MTPPHNAIILNSQDNDGDILLEEETSKNKNDTNTNEINNDNENTGTSKEKSTKEKMPIHIQDEFLSSDEDDLLADDVAKKVTFT